MDNILFSLVLVDSGIKIWLIEIYDIILKDRGLVFVNVFVN